MYFINEEKANFPHCAGGSKEDATVYQF